MEDDGRHRLLAGADALAAAASVVCDAAASADTLSDAEVLDAAEALCRVAARVEAARLAVLRVLDDRSDAIPGTDRPAHAFLTTRMRLDPRAAAVDVRAARALAGPGASLPAVGAALAAGEISRAHADVAVRTVERLPAALFTEPAADLVTGEERPGIEVADEWLAEQSRSLPVQATTRLSDALATVLDPDHERDRTRDALQRRSLVVVHERATGMGLLRGSLTPADTAMLTSFLSAATRPEPAAVPGAGSCGESGESGAGAAARVRDDRTLTMRRYDALMGLVRAGLTLGGPGGGAPDAASPPTTLLVTATLEQVAAAGHAAERTRADAADAAAGAQAADAGDATERVDRADAADAGGALPAAFGASSGLATLHRHGPVDPALLAYLVCAATLQRVLVAPSGAPLDVGRAQRLATAAQRKALAVRDGGCVISGCTVPHEGTDAHHLRAWSAGGRTDLDNLVSLCPRHHQEVHAGTWHVTIRDGRVSVLRPRWADPARHWESNVYHRSNAPAQRFGEHLARRPERPPDGSRGGAEGHPDDGGAGGEARPPPAGHEP